MISCFHISPIKIEGSIVIYIVKERNACEENMTRGVEYEVLSNTKKPVEVICICIMFNFKGYLCRHDFGGTSL